MADFIDNFYGKERKDKYNAFVSDITQLGLQHNEQLPKGATVEKAVMLFDNGNTVSFKVSDNFGEIPQYIKDKMVAVFEKHYKPTQTT
jgi:hypothetical protein